MNYGAYILNPNFLTPEETARLTEIALHHHASSTPTHESGRYASKLWSFVSLIEEKDKPSPIASLPEVKKIISYFKTPINMAVFYYLEPGGTLHPHRDLTGATLNDRIRFHIPLKTNENVIFKAAGERVRLEPGTFWALDTSYIHSVQNNGNEVRIHIVIECDVNDWAKSLLAKPNWRTFVHDIYYACYLVTAVAKSLLVNSWKDPKYLAAQLGMGVRFIKWRTRSLLGKDQ